MRPFLLAMGCALLLFCPRVVAAEDAPAPHLSRFGAGDGPSIEDGVLRLLDEGRSPGQQNAIAYDRVYEGAYERMTLRCALRVLEGGDGGAFVFLNTAAYGVHGPAPFLKSAVEPNLGGTFAVGIDVYNPPTEEPFGPMGNVMGAPEREVSLHFDSREIVKRVAPAEFRGAFKDLWIDVRHVSGGAEVTVEIAGAKIYDAYFVASLLPYESRLAMVAGTRADATTTFDVRHIHLEVGEPAARRRVPLHVEVFNHALTDNSKTAFEAEVALPPSSWAFGRVILTLEIHDAGKSWDEWDRCGEISVFDKDGVKHPIVPFITSYRTPCHWRVDVTHFRPWLSGATKLEIAAGTTFYKNRGFMMSVSLDYYHGTPDLEGYRVVPLWVGTAHYKSPENHFQDFFEPQTVAIEEDAVAARVFVATTGHSQVGEFTPSERTVVFEPGEGEAQRFSNVLWKTDCYLNPNRPQYGTWKYPRAGWAPGDVVRPWWIDLTPTLVPGKEATFRYEPQPYDFGDEEKAPSEAQVNQASHNVRAYLILQRKAEQSMPAPILRVANVSKGSNAAKAGMKRGDYLASYDGRRVDSIEDLRAAMGAAMQAKKERVPVVVFRGAEQLDLELDVGQMGVNLGGS